MSDSNKIVPEDTEDTSYLDDIIAFVDESGATDHYIAKLRLRYINATDLVIKKDIGSILAYLEKPIGSTSITELLQCMERIEKLKNLGIISDGLDEEIERAANLRQAGIDPEKFAKRVVGIMDGKNKVK